jgi:hypothetical protein
MLFLQGGLGLFVYGLIEGLILGLKGGLIEGLILGVRNGLMFGLIAFFWYGGQDVIQHYTLRFILYRKGHTRLRYAHFLDYAARLVFLQKVGGGYIFIHRLLLEHFATQRQEAERKSKEPSLTLQPRRLRLLARLSFAPFVLLLVSWLLPFWGDNLPGYQFLWALVVYWLHPYRAVNWLKFSLDQSGVL